MAPIVKMLQKRMQINKFNSNNIIITTILDIIMEVSIITKTTKINITIIATNTWTTTMAATIIITNRNIKIIIITNIINQDTKNLKNHLHFFSKKVNLLMMNNNSKITIIGKIIIIKLLLITIIMHKITMKIYKTFRMQHKITIIIKIFNKDIKIVMDIERAVQHQIRTNSNYFRIILKKVEAVAEVNLKTKNTIIILIKSNNNKNNNNYKFKKLKIIK